ncbi:MAG: hypothetical protein ABFC56_16620 [Clostridiaceae bacterium]
MIEQAEYDDRYAGLLAQSRAIEARISLIEEQREQQKARKRELDAFYKGLKATGPIVEFDEDLWNLAVKKVEAQADGEIAFSFRKVEI